ncbi:MAG: ABC transporter permease subunit [Candidatus Heimdallarchaeota archaeon]
MTYKQIKFLIMRELQGARRTRGIMLMVVVMPLLFWGVQIVLPLMRLGLVANSGGTSQNSEISPIENLTPQDVSLDLGMPLMIALLVTFFTAVPYISSAIAGEKEKKTLESLLSLPLSRQKILSAKIVAGSLLGIISVIVNLTCFIIYQFVTNEIVAPSNNWSSIVFATYLSPTLIPMFGLTLMLCTLLNLGIGISIASLAKSAETSRQIFTLFMMPMLVFLTINLFTGIPEMLSMSLVSPLPLLLYLVPWEHALAIFQKTLLPQYFTSNNLLLIPIGNIWADVVFHLISIVFTLFLVIWIAAKVFERESLVN